MTGSNSNSSNSSSKSHEKCNYNVAMFPEDCVIREHNVGDLESNKKYYLNVLR